MKSVTHATIARAVRLVLVVSTLILSSLSLPAQSAKEDPDEDADAFTQFLEAFKKVPVPAPAQITAAAKVAESFLNNAFAGRGAEALALANPVYSGLKDAASLKEAFKAFSQKHGALKSALLLRGRAEALPPEPADASQKPTAATPAGIALYYLCETDKGLCRTGVWLEEARRGAGEWKVSFCFSAPLIGGMWSAWEMSVNAGFAVSLRARAATAEEWEPLMKAAQRQAKLFEAAVPPLPELTGKTAADVGAAKAWLTSTFPKAVQSRLPEKTRPSMNNALTFAEMHLRYEPGSPELSTLKKMGDARAEEWDEAAMFRPALSAGMSAAEFRRFMIAMAGEMSSQMDQEVEDPLRSALGTVKGSAEFAKTEADAFGGPIAAAVAMALTDARKAPGWKLQLHIQHSREDGSDEATAEVIFSGQSATISFSGFKQNPERIVIIGTDAWVSSDDGRTWAKNGANPSVTAFRALLNTVFKEDWANGRWELGGTTEGSSNDDAENIVISYHVRKAPAPDGKASAAPGYDLIKTTPSGWMVKEFRANADFGLGGKEPDTVRTGERHVDGRDGPLHGMTRLDKKPEIKPPAGG